MINKNSTRAEVLAAVREDGYALGNKYTGEYKEDKWHGNGTYTFANGNEYVGEFSDGKFKGQGTMTYADGTSESGIWGED